MEEREESGRGINTSHNIVDQAERGGSSHNTWRLSSAEAPLPSTKVPHRPEKIRNEMLLAFCVGWVFLICSRVMSTHLIVCLVLYSISKDKIRI